METRKNPGGISMDVVEERSASENISRFLSVMVDWAEQSKGFEKLSDSCHL